MRAVLYPALLMLVACGAGEPRSSAPTPSSDTTRVYLEPRWLGVAYCTSGAPHAWIRVDVVGSAEGPQVLAHERDHLRIMQSFESCDAFYEWTRSDPLNPMRMEASGHCAGAKVDAETGRVRSLNLAIQMHAARLAHSYPYGLNEAEAEVEIRKFCTPDGAP